MIPIKDLVGREGIGVYTYDPIEKRAKVCTAKNILKIGNEDRLLRVHFDDGSHIDCTEDHRFLAFKWGNQFTGEKEWQCEAKDLKPGMHLRALKESVSGPAKSKYITSAWSRRGRDKQHRLIAEWKIGRRILPGEQVHHKDLNRLNNRPENLEVKANAKEHFAEHPEIAQRMRENNPAKNGLTPEWKEKIAIANRGKVRSPQSRERYRQAAIKREASHEARRSVIVNHCVVSVEELSGKHETFCLEIPETGWFYANKVLVKNCCFCGWPATMTGNDPDGTQARSVRCHSPEWVEAMIEDRLMRGRAKGINYRSIYIDDDTFNLTDKHAIAISAVMKRIGLPWSAMCRADTCKPDTWRAMKDSGCFGVKVGCESGSQHVIDTIVNKRLNLHDVEFKWLPLLKEIGITVHTTWTEGLPGETPDQRSETHAMIQRLYDKGLHRTHQLSGTAEISGTPLHTLRVKGDLQKYPGAHVGAGYEVSFDGQRKVEVMEK
jgi:hypothetical protein